MKQEQQSEASAPFIRRHIGPSPSETEAMLKVIGARSLDELIEKTVPAQIRLKSQMNIAPGQAEHEVLAELREIASQNKVRRSLIGQGYYDTLTPAVIQRNIMENPGWYTQYTPYQAEISQGRLEALLNFQTVVSELTGMEIANASMLDEATAAAEAMTMFLRLKGEDSRNKFFISESCFPQTIAVVRMRAEPLGIDIVLGDHQKFTIDQTFFGALVQYPNDSGEIFDYSSFCKKAHEAGAMVAVAADILSLTLLTPPGEFGADCVVGNTQRFGVPLGYGGPHAAYMATKSEFQRQMPGRLIGVSKDANGKPALRLALQTREQHIRREKATSNICTAQVLLAVMAGMYAVYHGPKGLSEIAAKVHALTSTLRAGLEKGGASIRGASWFDTLRFTPAKISAEQAFAKAAEVGINLRRYSDGSLGISLDECATESEVALLIHLFGAEPTSVKSGIPAALRRKSEFLNHAVFNSYHSETEMLRYIKRLESRDLSLTASMIPLGSCTMKLNATSEMFPVTWPEFSKLHPFAPIDQAGGYLKVFADLEKMLCEVTGFAGVSLQPNAGSAGEYTGLLVIRAYHLSRGDKQRTVCLIPSSAHGTNPASAVMAGMDVVVVKCDEQGNIDMGDLEEKAKQHAANLAAVMVTYPSTHGVFEDRIKELCDIIHKYGGQVYMDGANMNAQVGLCSPGNIGADVCHLNLHKTFCIPHGGGGPGMGPIGVAKHLTPFLPGHVVGNVGGKQAIGPVSAAPWGSSSILLISWIYIKMMGGVGLTEATKYAILNANYIAKRLENHYPVVYRGKNGQVAHECILDLRPIEKSCGVKVEDLAKRLMDYSFHAPTVAWPVIGTIMVEPTESEAKAELDRFCDAMIQIRSEIREIEQGKMDRENNPLKNAPHTIGSLVADSWEHPYSRECAAYPVESLRSFKFWPAVARIDGAYGDRNLVCSCVGLE